MSIDYQQVDYQHSPSGQIKIMVREASLLKSMLSCQFMLYSIDQSLVVWYQRWNSSSALMLMAASPLGPDRVSSRRIPPASKIEVKPYCNRYGTSTVLPTRYPRSLLHRTSRTHCRHERVQGSVAKAFRKAQVQASKSSKASSWSPPWPFVLTG